LAFPGSLSKRVRGGSNKVSLPAVNSLATVPMEKHGKKVVEMKSSLDHLEIIIHKWSIKFHKIMF
jgi:hypothetical protein